MNCNQQVKQTLSQSDTSILIARLVQAIEASTDSAFMVTTDEFGDEQISTTPLSKYFDHIQSMIDLFYDHYYHRPYSCDEYLKAFMVACEDIELERGISGPVCLNDTGTEYLSVPETLNVLVDRIRELTGTRQYHRAGSDRRYQSRQQQLRVTDYVNSLLDSRSRTLVVRVDLYYQEIARPRLKIEDVFDDLDSLMKARERNPIFEHEVGYICSIEQGQRQGYHIHAAFFFDSSQVRSDFHKARQIGELWQAITDGRGCFHNCNQDKERYGDRCGIGVIRRDDEQARLNVEEAMHYLVKEEQHLRLKPLNGREFRVGRFPAQ